MSRKVYFFVSGGTGGFFRETKGISMHEEARQKRFVAMLLKKHEGTFSVLLNVLNALLDDRVDIWKRQK